MFSVAGSAGNETAAVNARWFQPAGRDEGGEDSSDRRTDDGNACGNGQLSKSEARGVTAGFFAPVTEESTDAIELHGSFVGSRLARFSR